MEALGNIGVTVNEEIGITNGNVSSLKELVLDGSKHSFNNIEAISELKALKSLTLKNVKLNNLNGLEGCSLLNYIYFYNSDVADYNKLSQILDLKYLYFYIPSSMSEEIANSQVINLGNGLKKATDLHKLEYFGIFGNETALSSNYDVTNQNNKLGFDTWDGVGMNQLTNIDSLDLFPLNIKETVKYVFCNHNGISSISSLSGFSNIYQILLIGDANLTTLSGLKGKTNLTFVFAQNCNLTSIEDLENSNKLYYLIIWNNKNLQSLGGLGGSNSLFKLLANDCRFS